MFAFILVAWHNIVYKWVNGIKDTGPDIYCLSLTELEPPILDHVQGRDEKFVLLPEPR